jgi:hypothetical protein
MPRNGSSRFNPGLSRDGQQARWPIGMCASLPSEIDDVFMVHANKEASPETLEAAHEIGTSKEKAKVTPNGTELDNTTHSFEYEMEGSIHSDQVPMVGHRGTLERLSKTLSCPLSVRVVLTSDFG